MDKENASPLCLCFSSKISFNFHREGMATFSPFFPFFFHAPILGEQEYIIFLIAIPFPLFFFAKDFSLERKHGCRTYLWIMMTWIW